jgi:beta-phosphoglucomutase
MSIKACIFDMDGVIVDSAKYHFVAWQELAQDIGVKFTVQDNEQLKGLSRVDSLERILKMGNLHLDNDTKLALMDKKNQSYLQYISSMNEEEILPGVGEFIEELVAAGMKVALGSSSRNATVILERINLLSKFDAIIDGNKVTFSKPDPEVFLKGAEAMGLQPEDCVVFEDASAGVKAAIDGGFRCVGIGEEQHLSKANFVIPGFQDFRLNDLIQRFK